MAEAGERLHRNDDESWRRAQLVRMRQDQHVRIAARDLLDIDDVVDHRSAPRRGWTRRCSRRRSRWSAPTMPFAIVGMGRLGGAEMSYASDLDVLLVYDDGRRRGRAKRWPNRCCTSCTARARPSGWPPSTSGCGPRAAKDDWHATSHGYAAYFDRWAETWERQALVRARVVAGDSALGERFMALAGEFVWGRPLTEDEVAAIRRMKARIERERISSREDPQFHLKLGRGSLSDIEWTVQLLQLRHHVRRDRAPSPPSTPSVTAGSSRRADRRRSRDAYRFCERTRNRWHLVGALPGGASPGRRPAHPGRPAVPPGQEPRAPHPSSLRDDYRRVTRRARRVVERAFYGIEDA